MGGDGYALLRESDTRRQLVSRENRARSSVSRLSPVVIGDDGSCWGSWVLMDGGDEREAAAAILVVLILLTSCYAVRF